jgi:hypothetical protein
MQIPIPGSMELPEWAAGTVYALGQYTSISQFLDGSDWQEWGLQFFNNPRLARLNPPNPYDFSDWRLWGERLQNTLASASGNPKHG